MTLLITADNPKPPRARWRKSALLFSGFSFLVFCINLSGALWASLKGSGGLAILSESDCDTVKTRNTIVHLVINVLSSILLSGSNYCMQCLMGPTRKQIDKAHARKSWLDIGIPSIRNFSSLTKRDKTFWLVLGLSSFPLHLFYNSVVFTTGSASVYRVWTAPQGYIDLLDSASSDNTTLFGFPNSTNTRLQFLNDDGGMKSLNRAYKRGKLTRLTAKDCFDGYTKSFQSKWNDLFLVTRAPGTATGYVGKADAEGIRVGRKEIFQWACDGFGFEQFADGVPVPCEQRLPAIKANTTAVWTFDGQEVSHCLSYPGTEHCKMQSSTALLWLVTCASLVKAALFLAFALVSKEDRILTIGDAISSFLEYPDATTVGDCLLTKKEVVANRTGNTVIRYFSDKRERGFVAASSRRWGFSICLYFLTLTACATLLAWGIAQLHGYVKSSTVFSWGLGTLVARALITWPFSADNGTAGIIIMSIVANAPQAVISFIYFTYNGLFTSVSSAREWSSYATKRAGLRVSSKPVGQQRSAYFLTLPYRLSLPLISLSVLIHWLVGRSLFLVSIEFYTSQQPGGQARLDDPIHDPAITGYKDLVTTGWSPLGLVLVIVTVTVMILFLLIVARRELPSGMPVVASCSLAMSAACHTIPHEQEAWNKEVTWGVTPGKISDDESDVPHCSFTSDLNVESPVRGEVYK